MVIRATQKVSTSTPIYVQYGCGLCAPQGWMNFDASPRLQLERMKGVGRLMKLTAKIRFPENALYGDIVRGLPVPDVFANGVYCSHVLEHLAREEVPIALRNTFRILRPLGIFRLVLPDLKWRITQYTESKNEGTAADELMEALGVGTRARPGDLVSWLSAHSGNSKHLWMYDYPALKLLLEHEGFSDIRRCKLGDSRDTAFLDVEDAGRFFDRDEAELAIEAVRPL